MGYAIRYRDMCDKFNDTFNPEVPENMARFVKYGSVTIEACRSFFEKELLTPEVVDKFSAVHLEPSIEVSREGVFLSVRLCAGMMPSHPLYSDRIRSTRRVCTYTLFLIKRRRIGSELITCNCVLNHGNDIDGTNVDAFDRCYGYFKIVMVDKIDAAYRDIKFVDDVLSRIGDDDMARKFVSIMNNIVKQRHYFMNPPGRYDDWIFDPKERKVFLDKVAALDGEGALNE